MPIGNAAQNSGDGQKSPDVVAVADEHAADDDVTDEGPALADAGTVGRHEVAQRRKC